MGEAEFEHEDVEVISGLLERELRLHRRKCVLCFIMFVLALLALVGALCVTALRLVANEAGAAPISLADRIDLVDAVVPLSAIALSFFGLWWSAQNCQNSIERALCAARNNRIRLFRAFFAEIHCAGKKKQHAWLEIIKTGVA